jgi:hypothetical protein
MAFHEIPPLASNMPGGFARNYKKTAPRNAGRPVKQLVSD